MEYYDVLPKAFLNLVIMGENDDLADEELRRIECTSQAGGGDPCSSNLAEFRYVKMMPKRTSSHGLSKKNIERYW